MQHGSHLTWQAVGGFPFERERLESSVPAAQVELPLCFALCDYERWQHEKDSLDLMR